MVTVFSDMPVYSLLLCSHEEKKATAVLVAHKHWLFFYYIHKPGHFHWIKSILNINVNSCAM